MNAEFDGLNIHIGNTYVYPSGLVYFAERYDWNLKGTDVGVLIFDDFGDLVKTTLGTAITRHRFRADLH